MSIDNLVEPVCAARIVCDVNGAQVSCPDDFDLTLDPADFIASHEGGLSLEKIRAWLAAQGGLSRIEIRVPKFTDGRGFSLASRLREAGYVGELHASGDITQDLFFLLRRVGFSHVHLALKPGEALDPAVLNPFGGYYQTAYE